MKLLWETHIFLKKGHRNKGLFYRNQKKQNRSMPQEELSHFKKSHITIPESFSLRGDIIFPPRRHTFPFAEKKKHLRGGTNFCLYPNASV